MPCNLGALQAWRCLATLRHRVFCSLNPTGRLNEVLRVQFHDQEEGALPATITDIGTWFPEKLLRLRHKVPFEGPQVTMLPIGAGARAGAAGPLIPLEPC